MKKWYFFGALIALILILLEASIGFEKTRWAIGAFGISLCIPGLMVAISTHFGREYKYQTGWSNGLTITVEPSRWGAVATGYIGIFIALFAVGFIWGITGW